MCLLAFTPTTTFHRPSCSLPPYSCRQGALASFRTEAFLTHAQMPRTQEMRRFNSAQGVQTKLGSPVIRGYGSTHGTPVFGIYLERSPRPIHTSIISPTYSDVSDATTPSSSPIKAEPPLPLYSIELNRNQSPPSTIDIPLIPIPSPKLLNQQRAFSVQQSRPALYPTLSLLSRNIASQLGRNGRLRRVLTYLLLAGAAALFVHSLSSFLSSPSPPLGRRSDGERARARTLLYRDPTRHAAVGADVAPVHFTGDDAHAHRLPGLAQPPVGSTRDIKGRPYDAEERTWRTLPKQQQQPRKLSKPIGRPLPPPAPRQLSNLAAEMINGASIAGVKPGLARLALANAPADPRNWSAAAAARQVDARYRPSINVAPAPRSPQQQLAGGLAYPGLIEARRAAAEAYRTAVGRRGATDAAKKAAKEVLAAAVVAEKDPIRGALTRPAAVIAPGAVEAMKEYHPVPTREAKVDLEPEREIDMAAEQYVVAVEASQEDGDVSIGDERRMQRGAKAKKEGARLPLRLARFKDERFARAN